MAIFRQTFEIESSIPPEEAWKNLLAIVKTDLPVCAGCGHSLAGATRFCSHCGQPVPPPVPRTWLQRNFSSSDGFQFEGDVSPQGFNITRIISYRNSCIPVIRGQFEPSATGTKIVIEMTMHPVGYVFLVGGSGIAFIVCTALSENSPVTGIVAFAVPCLIGVVCWVAFTGEARTARTALSGLWPVSANMIPPR